MRSPGDRNSPQRSRLVCGLAISGVVAAGLFLRSRYCPLPLFVVKYGADALWALMVYLGVGWLFPRASRVRVGGSAMALSTTIEFSQLYHAPWIDAVRATRPGALILGSVFNWPDIHAYAAGIVLGIAAERFLLLPSSSS